MGRPRKDGTAAAPKQSKDALKEKSAAVRAFVSALDGVEAIMGESLTVDRLPELTDFLIALEGAAKKARKAHATLQFAHKTLQELERMQEKLRTVGQSDAVKPPKAQGGGKAKGSTQEASGAAL